jgi:2-keto-4-pentenoate hydratase/2-oxohepta-3-ene-1,7-dioic acid hydratase in catechol pathway
VKWLSYATGSGTGVGVLAEDGVHPYPGSESLLGLVESGPQNLSAAAERALAAAPYELAALELVAPFRPPSMRDAMCFHEHIRNCALDGEALDERHSLFPAFYFSNPAAVLGPYDDVPIAPGSEQYDYELEIGAVIGRRGHNIHPADAEGYIAGYTIYIDWSARDVQFNEMGLRLGPAKGKDTATTLGPVLVTADELEPHRTTKGFDLAMTASVNGTEISTGNWATIDWSFADVIAYTSRGTTLLPGDVLGSGTVGWGCLFEHFQTKAPSFPGWLKPGDVVEMHVDGIGDTKQTIRAAETTHPLSSGW